VRNRLVLALLAFGLVAASCGDDTSVFDLSVGDCFNDSEDLTQTEVSDQAEISDVDTVDCSEPHDNEIYYEYSMTDALFPGADAILGVTSERCLDQFAGFVGIDYLDSDLDLFPITPTSNSWAEGDRVVYCGLYAMDFSKLAGTMAGSRR